MDFEVYRPKSPSYGVFKKGFQPTYQLHLSLLIIFSLFFLWLTTKPQDDKNTTILGRLVIFINTTQGKVLSSIVWITIGFWLCKCWCDYYH